MYFYHFTDQQWCVLNWFQTFIFFLPLSELNIHIVQRVQYRNYSGTGNTRIAELVHFKNATSKYLKQILIWYDDMIFLYLSHKMVKWLNGCSSTFECSNQWRRWWTTRRATERPPGEAGCYSSSVSFIFHAAPELSQIQFKCKATEAKLFVFSIFSISASAIAERRQYGGGLSPCGQRSTDHTDHCSVSK